MEFSNINERNLCFKWNREVTEMIYSEKIEILQEEIIMAEEKCGDKDKFLLCLYGEIKLLNEKF